jgi:hypothetical protein
MAAPTHGRHVSSGEHAGAAELGEGGPTASAPLGGREKEVEEEKRQVQGRAHAQLRSRAQDIYARTAAPEKAGAIIVEAAAAPDDDDEHEMWI